MLNPLICTLDNLIHKFQEELETERQRIARDIEQAKHGGTHLGNDYWKRRYRLEEFIKGGLNSVDHRRWKFG